MKSLCKIYSTNRGACGFMALNIIAEFTVRGYVKILSPETFTFDSFDSMPYLNRLT